MSKGDFIPGHAVRILRGGPLYFEELAALIRAARHELHLQVYIFAADSTGRAIFNELKAAVARGVKVTVLVDGFGSYGLRRTLGEELKGSGIRFRYFSPIPFPAFRQPGRRLHHKVVVADGRVALIGGINIADKYRGTEVENPWLDYAAHVEGPVCAELQQVCRHLASRKLVGRRRATALAGTPDPEGLPVRLRINDGIRGMREISGSYRQALEEAGEEIIILASYFIPTRRLLALLVRARRRGCRVIIILSRDSDVPVVKAAMRYLYGRLLVNGVRIYEYKSSVLHAKVCVTDRRWITVGSHNLNHLSEFLSLEMNLEIVGESLAHDFATELETLIRTECVEITAEQFDKSQNHVFALLNFIAYKMVLFSVRVLDLFRLKKRRQAG